jgi:hypothetical protein
MTYHCAVQYSTVEVYSTDDAEEVTYSMYQGHVPIAFYVFLCAMIMMMFPSATAQQGFLETGA